MENKLIAVTTLCSHYEIELSFVRALEHNGLIRVEMIREEPYLPEEQIRDFEKMIRLHQELNLNIEAIDVVFNLLEKEAKLRAELDALKSRLKRY